MNPLIFEWVALTIGVIAVRLIAGK